MKFTKMKCVLCLFVIFSTVFSPFYVPAVFASGHGCSMTEPDRDGDGVADKDDSFPDDPSRYKEEKEFAPQLGICGTEPVVLKLYFIPFSEELTAPVTQENIEKERKHELWFCRKNDVTETIKNILDRNSGGTSHSVPQKQAEGSKARYGLVEDEAEVSSEPEESPVSGLEGAAEKLEAAVKGLLEPKESEGLSESEGASKDAEEKSTPAEKQTPNDLAQAQDDLDRLFEDNSGLDQNAPADISAGEKSLKSDGKPPLNLEKDFSKDATGEMKMNSKQIRLKVAAPRDTGKEVIYLVDKSGYGTKNGTVFKLTSKEMAAIEKMIDSVSGVVDQTIASLGAGEVGGGDDPTTASVPDPI